MRSTFGFQLESNRNAVCNYLQNSSPFSDKIPNLIWCFDSSLWKSQHRSISRNASMKLNFNLKQRKDCHWHCHSWNWNSKIPGTTQSSIDRWEDNRCQYIAIFQTRLPANKEAPHWSQGISEKVVPKATSCRQEKAIYVGVCKFLLGKTPQIYHYPVVTNLIWKDKQVGWLREWSTSSTVYPFAHVHA